MASEVIPVETVTGVKWGALVLLGVLSVIFGLLIVLFPEVSATVMIELIGILIIVLSFATVMLAALSPGGWKSSLLLAILAIIGFFFGIATIVHPVVMRTGSGFIWVEAACSGEMCAPISQNAPRCQIT